MPQQSRAFVRMYAGEHLRLVAHIKRLGFNRQLGDDSLDAMLDVVASGGEWPDRGPPAPVARQIAEAAGALRQTATDATPPTRVQRPQGSASTAPVPSVVLPVRSTAPMEKAPAASAPPVIPPARGRGRGGASGVGEVRQGNFLTLPRHTPLGPRPPPGFPALDQVRDAPMAELASPSRDEPASVSTPSAPVSWQSDPRTWLVA